MSSCPACTPAYFNPLYCVNPIEGTMLLSGLWQKRLVRWDFRETLSWAAFPPGGPQEWNSDPMIILQPARALRAEPPGG